MGHRDPVLRCVLRFHSTHASLGNVVPSWGQYHVNSVVDGGLGVEPAQTMGVSGALLIQSARMCHIPEGLLLETGSLPAYGCLTLPLR